MPHTKLSYVEKLTRMDRVLAMYRNCQSGIELMKGHIEELADELYMDVDWETVSLVTRAQPKSVTQPITVADTEIAESPKLLYGHPLPWRAKYNGCIYFIMDANDECVATHSNKELIQILLDKSKEEFTGE